MKKKSRNIFIFLTVSVVAITFATLWLHTQKAPSKTISQKMLVSEFLGENIPLESVDYNQFCNSSEGADFCLVLNDVSCEDFIKTIDFCCEDDENYNSEYTYTYYQDKFPFLNTYMYSSCINYACLFRGCEYSKGYSFFETTYETHYPIYMFSFQKNGNQRLIICSSLPYHLHLSGGDKT